MYLFMLLHMYGTVAQFLEEFPSDLLAPDVHLELRGAPVQAVSTSLHKPLHV